jgi:hypothetical protein
MYSALTTLVDRLDSVGKSMPNIIRWGCPVPSFGDLSRATVATLGLNPSNREFMDSGGKELKGPLRRFPTLGSLNLKKWADADSSHLKIILDACHGYFQGNPYDRWFRRLDEIVLGTEASFYDGVRCACHLDLIPFATSEKWANLRPTEKKKLVSIAGDTLGILLRDSSVNTLILNGKTVINNFEEIAGVELEKEIMPKWALPRTGKDVQGVAYRGIIDSICGVDLGRNVLVLGYNHNIQSSFGVTNKVISEIHKWTRRHSLEARA